MSATVGTIQDRLRASIQHAVLHHRSPDLEHDALEEIKRLERAVAMLQRKAARLSLCAGTLARLAKTKA